MRRVFIFIVAFLVAVSAVVFVATRSESIFAGLFRSDPPMRILYADRPIRRDQPIDPRLDVKFRELAASQVPPGAIVSPAPEKDQGTLANSHVRFAARDIDAGKPILANMVQAMPASAVAPRPSADSLEKLARQRLEELRMDPKTVVFTAEEAAEAVVAGADDVAIHFVRARGTGRALRERVANHVRLQSLKTFTDGKEEIHYYASVEEAVARRIAALRGYGTIELWPAGATPVVDIAEVARAERERYEALQADPEIVFFSAAELEEALAAGSRDVTLYLLRERKLASGRTAIQREIVAEGIRLETLKRLEREGALPSTESMPADPSGTGSAAGGWRETTQYYARMDEALARRIVALREQGRLEARPSTEIAAKPRDRDRVCIGECFELEKSPDLEKAFQSKDPPKWLDPPPAAPIGPKLDLGAGGDEAGKS